MWCFNDYHLWSPSPAHLLQKNGHIHFHYNITKVNRQLLYKMQVRLVDILRLFVDYRSEELNTHTCKINNATLV